MQNPSKTAISSYHRKLDGAADRRRHATIPMQLDSGIHEEVNKVYRIAYGHVLVQREMESTGVGLV
ncbi:MAG: hypothetical protein ACLQLG_00490 [Thermoguttaceae bacterium]